MNNFFTPNQSNRLSQLETQQMNNPFSNYQNFQLPQKKANVIYSLVSGLDGANNFALMTGEVGLLFDGQKNEFYKKTIDEMGMTTLKKYEYKEVQIPVTGTAGIGNNDAILNKRMENIENALQILLQQYQQKNVPEKPEKKQDMTLFEEEGKKK